MERWLSKVDKHGPGGCWLWTGGKDRHGYGQFDVTIDGKRRNHRAHRWGYQQMVRELDPSETLDHLCRVHACVNPDHLEPVTHAVNVSRGESGKHHADKTHCINGHEFTPENTAHPIGHPTWRICRTCANARSKETSRKLRGYQGGITDPNKTHCINGHEFTPENTYYPPRGGRSCRECTRIKVKDYMRRRREEERRRREED